MTLVDMNVLLDVATDAPKWARWSKNQESQSRKQQCRVSSLVRSISTFQFSCLMVVRTIQFWSSSMQERTIVSAYPV
jgi:hypothetical protein